MEHQSLNIQAFLHCDKHWKYLKQNGVYLCQVYVLFVVDILHIKSILNSVNVKVANRGIKNSIVQNVAD